MSVFDKAFDALQERGSLNKSTELSIDDIRFFTIAISEAVVESHFTQDEIERDMIYILSIFDLLEQYIEEQFGLHLTLQKSDRIKRFIKRNEKRFIEGIAEDEARETEEPNKRDEVQSRVNHGNFKILRSGEPINPLSVFAFF